MKTPLSSLSFRTSTPTPSCSNTPAAKSCKLSSLSDSPSRKTYWKRKRPVRSEALQVIQAPLVQTNDLRSEYVACDVFRHHTVQLVHFNGQCCVVAVKLLGVIHGSDNVSREIAVYEPNVEKLKIALKTDFKDPVNVLTVNGVKRYLKSRLLQKKYPWYRAWIQYELLPRMLLQVDDVPNHSVECIVHHRAAELLF